MTTVIQTEKVKNRHLIFRISNDLYGLEVQYLKEVFQTGNILKLPRTSSVLEGIVNLRGYIVSIFNLSVLLWGEDSCKKEEISSINGSHSNIILLVTIKDQDIGILVDQIHQLDTITDFKAKDNSYFQGRELLNPSLISKVGFLDDKQNVFILNLEELLGDFVTSRKPGKKKTSTSDDDFDFDFDQYTLPDPEESSEKSTEASQNFDLEQLNFPENLQTDEFDQTILDKLDTQEKGSEVKKSDNSKKDVKETKSKAKSKAKSKSKKGKKAGKSSKIEDNIIIEDNSQEIEKFEGKDEIKETKE